MIYIITNQKQFDEAIKKAISNCVSYISDKILECVQKHILDDVYYYDFPNKWYNNGTKIPTFEFFGAFDFEGIKEKTDEVSNLLFYNWADMSAPSGGNPYLHGNFYAGIDRRSELASILNVVGINKEADLRGKKRNAFWDNAIGEIEQKFDLWAREAYNKYLK